MDQITKWAVELQSIAQDGLEYCHDRFDRERYEQVRKIATEMMAAKTGLSINVVKGLFSSDDGYQTPKVSTRAAIFSKQKILLVKETTDILWSMPGGWCEPNITVKENCIKEAEEESGHKIEVEQIIAVNNHSTNIYDKELSMYVMSSFCVKTWVESLQRIPKLINVHFLNLIIYHLCRCQEIL